jgi:hypothetical protein
MGTTTTPITPATPAPTDSVAIIGIDPSLEPIEVYLDANGMVDYMISKSPSCFDCVISKGNAVLNTDGLPADGFTLIEPGEKVYWGRWEGDWYVNGSIGQGSLHFINSPNITPQGDLDTLKAGGVVASFSQWSPNDGTIPTDENGNLGSYIGVPRFNVNFGTSSIYNYQVNVGFSSTGRSFYGSQPTPASFTGPSTNLSLDVFCSGCSASTGTGEASVTFTGTNATHAISSYQMNAGTNDAVGTILFTDDSLP